MIAVIGCGGAGGNIADIAAKRGFQAGAINFSQKDLESLSNVKNKLRIMGSDGVGHDRDKAISLIKESYETVINFVQENFSSNLIEAIIITFSTGGGSGAGISPFLIDVLSNVMEDKVFVAMPIMPDTSEMIVSQANCSRTFEELSKLDVAVMPIDNQKIIKLNANIGKNMMYKIANEKSISIIEKVISYTERFSQYGNFDKKDFLTTLGTKGIYVISEADITSLTSNRALDLSPNGIVSAIHKSWDNSIFVDVERDYIIRAGIIFDAQENIMQYIDHHLIFEQFKNMPIDIFEGNYHENNGKIITILSGLPWCSTRLAEVDKIIEKGADTANLLFSVDQTYRSKANLFVDKVQKVKEKPKGSIMDILNKYKR